MRGGCWGFSRSLMLKNQLAYASNESSAEIEKSVCPGYLNLPVVVWSFFAIKGKENTSF